MRWQVYLTLSDLLPCFLMALQFTVILHFSGHLLLP
jgi:hypothetical protein